MLQTQEYRVVSLWTLHIVLQMGQNFDYFIFYEDENGQAYFATRPSFPSLYTNKFLILTKKPKSIRDLFFARVIDVKNKGGNVFQVTIKIYFNIFSIFSLPFTVYTITFNDLLEEDFKLIHKFTHNKS